MSLPLQSNLFRVSFVFIVAAILFGCNATEKSKLQNAAKCGNTDLTDNKTTIIGRYSKDELVIFKCVLDFVDMPDWARSKLSSTRAIDGKQTAEWDDFIANWSYNGEYTDISIRLK